MKKGKRKRGLLDRLFESEPEDTDFKDKVPEPKLQPALRQIGITNCPVCKRFPDQE